MSEEYRLKYEEMKRIQAERLSSPVTVHGIPIGGPNFGWLDRWIEAIIWANCLCVQDTPENPCPCRDLVVIWIPKGACTNSGPTGRKSPDGYEIYSYELKRDAEIWVEELKTYKASELSNLISLTG